MSETKHTPGPWRFDLHHVMADLEDRTILVASTEHGRNRMPASEQNANARLIAAAPELLEALKAVQALLPEDIQEKARAAIAKAEGHNAT